MSASVPQVGCFLVECATDPKSLLHSRGRQLGRSGVGSDISEFKETRQGRNSASARAVSPGRLLGGPGVSG